MQETCIGLDTILKPQGEGCVTITSDLLISKSKYNLVYTVFSRLWAVSSSSCCLLSWDYHDRKWSSNTVMLPSILSSSSSIWQGQCISVHVFYPGLNGSLYFSSHCLNWHEWVNLFKFMLRSVIDLGYVDVKWSAHTSSCYLLSWTVIWFMLWTLHAQWMNECLDTGVSYGVVRSTPLLWFMGRVGILDRWKHCTKTGMDFTSPQHQMMSSVNKWEYTHLSLTSLYTNN